MVGWDLTGEEAVLIPHTSKRSRPISEDELRRLPTHDWSIYPKQRLLLFYIDRRYDNDLDDITNIFNFAFSEILTEGRLPKGKLSAQLYESATWQISYVEDFLSLPDELLPGKFSKIHELIVESARALRLTLVRRIGPSRVETSKASLKRKQRAPTAGIDSDSSVDMSTHDSDSEVESTPRASKRTARSFHTTSPLASRTGPSTLAGDTESSTLPQSEMTGSYMTSSKSVLATRHDRYLLPAIAITPPVTPSKSSLQTRKPPGVKRRKPPPQMPEILSHGEFFCENHPIKSLIRYALDGLPYLLFRSWDKKSHGINSVSGFSSGLTIDGIPMLDSDLEFLRHAEAHLWGREQPSPFVSLTTSLPTALRKAAHQVAKGGSPVIAVLDARSVALHTRLYHAREVITTLRRRGVKLKYYGSNGEYEYLAWQKADAIIGQVSLDHLREWTQKDDCLGALLTQNDLGNMGVPAFRQRCRHALAVEAEELTEGSLLSSKIGAQLSDQKTL